MSVPLRYPGTTVDGRMSAEEYLATAKPKKPAAMTEAKLHKSVATYLGYQLKPPVIWTTIGHGGGGRVRGARLKAMGVQRGWPDILILAPGPVVLGIELKRPGKGGSQSPEQVEIEAAFGVCNAWYAVCKSVDAVKGALAFIGVTKAISRDPKAAAPAPHSTTP